MYILNTFLNRSVYIENISLTVKLKFRQNIEYTVDANKYFFKCKIFKMK